MTKGKNELHTFIVQVRMMVIALMVLGLAGIAGVFYPGMADAKTGSGFNVPQNFTELAEMASPAVVNIRTVKTIQGGGRVFKHFKRGPFRRDDPFQEFFERFFGEGMPKEYKQRSLGSGFIIDKQGYIVTNNHVIENADDIRVQLKGGKEFDAEIIGRDPNTDLALIKVKTDEDLPMVKLGNSESLKVGEWVMAIGNPFGLEHTVTTGIVSAKGRVIGSGPYDDFIQTDASINPGNSGGPLLDMSGEVVGINTAIVAGGQGIGFAVPVDLAKNVIKQLKENGEVVRGWIGVAIQDISDEIADYYGIKDKKGVIVSDVFEGDPADKAGIRAKDVIIEVNGKSISTSRELTGMIADIGVGDVAEIKIIRDGEEKKFKVKVAQREDARVAKWSGRHSDGEDTIGLEVSTLTPELADRFGIKEDQGVLVTSVESGSRAEEAGFKSGDIIKEINRKTVRDIKDYTATLRDVSKGDEIHFFIKRKNAGFLVLKLTK